METTLLTIIPITSSIEFKHIQYYEIEERKYDIVMRITRNIHNTGFGIYKEDINNITNVNRISIINNVIKALKGFETLYKARVRLRGVGYKFALNDTNTFDIDVGKTHICPVNVDRYTSICIKKRKRRPKLRLTHQNQEKLNLYPHFIRKIKSADPYKGKGIRQRFEKIKWKEGKKTK